MKSLRLGKHMNKSSLKDFRDQQYKSSRDVQAYVSMDMNDKSKRDKDLLFDN